MLLDSKRLDNKPRVQSSRKMKQSEAARAGEREAREDMKVPNKQSRKRWVEERKKIRLRTAQALNKKRRYIAAIA